MLFSAESVRFSYDGIFSLNDVSIDVDRGELVAIFGLNGSGKTTLLNVLYGMLGVQRGRVLFEGKKVDGLSPSQLIKRGILFLPQGRRVFPSLTIYENLKVMFSHMGSDNAKIDHLINDALSFFPLLSGRKRTMAGNLSGGEQQMLALARAMVAKPKLLLLDEPSLGLSPKWVKDVFERIAAIKESGISIILVEQKIREALEIADRCYILKLGSVAWEGNTEELVKDKMLEKVFMGGSELD